MLATDGGQSVGVVVDNGDGTYSAALTATSVAGASTVTARDLSVSPVASGSVTLTQLGPAQPLPALRAAPIATAPIVTLRRAPPRRTRDHTPSFLFGASPQARPSSAGWATAPGARAARR